MKYSILLPFLVLIMTHNLEAQLNLERFNDNGNVGQVFANMRKKRDVTNALPTVGSPYLKEDFVPCSVFFDDELIGNFYYRHNAFNDEIEIKDANIDEAPVSSLVTNKSILVKNIVTGQTITLMPFRDQKGVLKNGYVYYLAEGPTYSLVQKNEVRFKPGTRAVNSLVRSTPNRYTKDKELYLKRADNQVAEYIRGGKKKFLDLLMEKHREPAMVFIQNEKLSLRNPGELSQLIDYLNTLP